MGSRRKSLLVNMKRLSMNRALKMQKKPCNATSARLKSCNTKLSKSNPHKKKTQLFLDQGIQCLKTARKFSITVLTHARVPLEALYLTKSKAS